MAINRAGLRVEKGIRWWATYHPSAMVKEGWATKQATRGFTVIIHEHNEDLAQSGLRFRIFPAPWMGSSTLFGVMFGLSIGYERVWIAGAPLDDPRYHVFRQGWLQCRKALCGRVFSMSGWTRQFLEGLNHG